MHPGRIPKKKEKLSLILCLALTCLVSYLGGSIPVEKTLSDMSIREKAGQMILVYNSPYEFLDKYNIGGVLIMQSMLKNADRIKNELQNTQQKMKIPLLIAIDQEGGSVNRLGYLPQWKYIPSAQIMAHWPSDSIFTYQKRVAETLRSLGINLNLAPVLDPAKNFSGNQTYIDQRKRSYGTSPEEIEPPAAAFINAFSENNIGCIVKHFPGYDVTVNSDQKIAVSRADSMQIAGYMKPFHSLQRYHCGILMSSILYENMCNVPAVFCSEMVKLAREISPDGIIMTDDLWGVALRSFALPGHKIRTLTYPDTAFIKIVEYAVKAGNDMLMITYPEKVPLILDTIERLASDDPAILNHVNSAVRRIISLKTKLKLSAR